MDPLSNEQLIAFNKQGIIPGPAETEEAFQERSKHCLHIRETLAQYVKEDFPLKGDGKGPQELFTAAYRVTKPLYGIEPDWIPIFFSNFRLSPWHGGCAWIFQLEEDSPVAALFQLRKKYADPKQGWLYKGEEIVAHEMAHVGRMLFEEPQFEELLAYRSSPKPFRRWFGPIVKNSIESALFVMVLLLIVLLDLFFVIFGYESAYYQAIWLKIIPLMMMGYGFLRLGKKQRQFQRCLENLEQLFHEKECASHVAYRLTDEEIIAFGEKPPEQILEYVRLNKEVSLRWKAIAAAYFDVEQICRRASPIVAGFRELS